LPKCPSAIAVPASSTRGTGPFGGMIQLRVDRAAKAQFGGLVGERMSPTHATKNNTRYRYYVSRSLLAGTIKHSGQLSRPLGKVVGDAPGTDANDIPWLKLNVAAQRGNGTLTGVTTVQRINTQGGKLNGVCDQAGKLRAVPYAADYVFLRNN
jgi:hypothetical protein